MGVDYKAQYAQWTRGLRAKPGFVRTLRGANTALTGLFYVAYAVLLVLAAMGDPLRLVPLVGVLAVAFALVSAFRRRFNAPRPYEVWDIEPLISRDGSGCSFPSRHAFSAFAIATAWFAVSAPAACVLLVCAWVMAACRVLGGQHFPRDVVVGALIGMAAGALAALIALAL